MSAGVSAQYQTADHTTCQTTPLPRAQAEMTTLFTVGSTTDMSEAVTEAMNKSMDQDPTLTILTSYANSVSDAKPHESHHKCCFPPSLEGKIQTADSMVVRTLIWPHELVYTGRGVPTI